MRRLVRKPAGDPDLDKAPQSIPRINEKPGVSCIGVHLNNTGTQKTNKQGDVNAHTMS